MRDWCKNYMKISGDKNKIKSFENLLNSEEKECCIVDKLQKLFQFSEDMDFCFKVLEYKYNNTQNTIEIHFISINWPPFHFYNFLEEDGFCILAYFWVVAYNECGRYTKETDLQYYSLFTEMLDEIKEEVGENCYEWFKEDD